MPADSLADVTPAILLDERIHGGQPTESLLFSGGKVAFARGSRLYTVDPENAEVESTRSITREGITSAVYDKDGNAYFAGYRVYSVAPDGAIRWSTHLPQEGDDLIRARGRMVIDPNGDLYFSTTDGYLYGVNGSDGSVRWKTLMTGANQALPVLVGGIGSALLAFSPEGTWRGQMWDRNTGEAMAYFTSARGERYGTMIGSEIGIVTQRMEDRGGSYPWMHISALDECSNERWHLPAERPQWPVLIGPDDQLFVVERDDYPNSQTEVSIYSSDGQRVSGPTPMPIPWAIGADGTIYSVACDSPAMAGPSRIYAHGPDLQELWMLPLGDGCPMSAPIIDDTGRMFFMMYKDATYMVAVQTASPGLAKSAWPTRRADLRGSGWIE